MLAIDELLRQATGSPVDTIVHVGAGSGAVLDRYAQLAPSKVVLVEGDPEAAAALQRAARPFPWAQVVAQAVGQRGRRGCLEPVQPADVERASCGRCADEPLPAAAP